MKFKKPVNPNYVATITKVSNIIPLDNCDYVIHALILGNLVIVSKETNVNDFGLYFPVETQLSDEFLSMNNLFRHAEKNLDKDKAGYFEDNGRIRSVKFRGHASQGFFIPLTSLSYITDNYEDFIKNENSDFDEFDGRSICSKYIVRQKGANTGGNSRPKTPKVSKLVDGQFKFHDDTNQLYKNYHKLQPSDVISLTSKIHGTSAISSNLLCKKKLNIFSKFLRWAGVPMVDIEYDYIYSSRKCIKNDSMNKVNNHYYKTDVWFDANEIIKNHIDNGMTVYYEIAGYSNKGEVIQKGYNGLVYTYGAKEKEMKMYIYRLTYTNVNGKVFEFSIPQIREWCKLHGLEMVPEVYYGKAIDLYTNLKANYNRSGDVRKFQDKFFETLKTDEKFYMEQDCPYCNNGLPFEGMVLRIDSNFKNDAFKVKCDRFYAMETKMIDKGLTNMEDNQ